MVEKEVSRRSEVIRQGEFDKSLCMRNTPYSEFLMEFGEVTRSEFYWRSAYYPNMFSAMLEHMGTEIPALSDLHEAIINGEEGLVVRASEELPFAGLSVLEIGGPFAQVLHGLGAEAWCVDPDINGESEYTEERWLYAPSIRADQYHAIPARITGNNAQQLLGDQTFDLVFSKYVLSIGSGTSSDWRWQAKRLKEANRFAYEAHHDLWTKLWDKNLEADLRACQEIFEVSAMVARPGGLIIHQGDRVEELASMAPQLGLVLLEESLGYDHFDGDKLFVFRKVA